MNKIWAGQIHIFLLELQGKKPQSALVGESKGGAVSSDPREDKQDVASHLGVSPSLTFSYEHQESPIKHWPPLLAPASDIL